MNTNKITYTIKCNRAKRTYTIREYLNGKIWAKYRSYPQGADYSENWTQNDIRQFLNTADCEYYLVKDWIR